MTRLVAGVIPALVLAMAGTPLSADRVSARPEQAPNTLTTRFTYSASVPKLPDGANSLDLWLPLPSDGAFQTIHDVKVAGPQRYRITRESRFGNRMVYFHVIHPQTPLQVSVTFTAERHAAAAMGPGKTPTGKAEDIARDLQPDSMVPVGGRWADTAAELCGDRKSPADKAEAIYNYVVANMQYDYKKESPNYGKGDVAFVCDYKKGNCCDLHSYLMSVARSAGIPAYLELGFPITGVPVDNPLKQDGTIGGYHCWTWIHDPQRGWLPVDASDSRRWLDAKRPDVSKKLFGSLVLERSAVAFSRGRDIVLNPRQKGGPLNYFIYPYAEADGKPIDATWEVRYHLLQDVAARNP